VGWKADIIGSLRAFPLLTRFGPGPLGHSASLGTRQAHDAELSRYDAAFAGAGVSENGTAELINLIGLNCVRSFGETKEPSLGRTSCRGRGYVSSTILPGVPIDLPGVST
jgi:hypothetical protein